MTCCPPRAPTPAAASSGSISEEYGYDGDGLRKTKTTSGQRTHQAYDLTGSLPQIITDGPTAYITGPGGLPIEQITAAGTVRYFSQDQLGSTTALTDALGVTVQSYGYDPYGQLTSATPTIENPFRYAGQYTDDATGFQYLRARYYDPTTGQFLSRDPLESSTLQPYSYADNNPTNATDPTGMLSLSDISDAAAGVLDAGSGGLSTRLAGSIFNFDVDCADFGAGFAVGQIAGTVIGPGKFGAAARGIRGAMEARAAATGAVEVGTRARTALVARDGTEIVGFTRHGINRAIGDGGKRAGVRPAALLDAIKNPTRVTSGVDSLGRPFKIYRGTDARVVINPEAGRIVSVNPRTGAGASR